MKNYIEYVLYNRDDSPIYFFENECLENTKNNPEASKIKEDYKVPKYFENDILGLLEKRKQPPH